MTLEHMKELTANSWDIGTVSGVLQGIELTSTLLPHQKEAIANARKAIERIGERNQNAIDGIQFRYCPWCGKAK